MRVSMLLELGSAFEIRMITPYLVKVDSIFVWKGIPIYA